MNADSVELIRGSQSILFVTGYQYGWYLSDFKDWLGTSDDKVGTVERPQSHGAFDVSKSLRTSKTPSFRVGHNSMGDAVAVESAIDELSAIGADGPVTMRVTTPAGVSERVVSIQVTHLDSEGLATGSVAVDCVARDPRRYAVGAQSAVTGPAQPGAGRVWPAIWPLVWPSGGTSGRITLTNTGKAPSAPTFILAGGFDTALITCLETGSRIGFNRQVPVGSSVVIDTANRTAMIDTQSDVSRWLRYREWELIPPGASRTFQFDASGAVTIPPGAPVEVDRQRFRNPAPTSTAGFATSNASISIADGGLKMVSSIATSFDGVRIVRLTPGEREPVTPGELVVLSADSMSASAREASISILFYDAANVFIPGAVFTSANFGGTGVFQRAAVSGEAPPNAASAGFYFGKSVGGAIAAGDSIVFRRIKFGSNSEYFDGSTAATGDFSYSWAGTANASESIKWFTPPAYVSASLEGQVRSAWW